MQSAHLLRTALVALGLIAIPLTCQGCISSMRVYEEENGKTRCVKGVPFYVKVEVPRRTSVYERTWHEATLRIERVQASPPQGGGSSTTQSLGSQVVKRRVGPAEQSALSEVVRKLAADDASALDAFLALPASGDGGAGAWRVVENRVEGVVLVDYGSRYFINAPLPWIGTSQVVPELAQDGTLNKVTVDVDTQVDEAVGSLAELAGSIAAFAPESEASASSLLAAEAPITGEPTVHERMSLEIEVVTERKVYTKTYPRGGAVNELLGEENPGDGFRTTRVAPAPAAAGKAPSKAYRVTGSITPPGK